jgi:hypothetical protein
MPGILESTPESIAPTIRKEAVDLHQKHKPNDTPMAVIEITLFGGDDHADVATAQILSRLSGWQLMTIEQKYAYIEYIGVAAIESVGEFLHKLTDAVETLERLQTQPADC